ncbi:MAG: hypothetical protein Q7T82_06070 [Armatimonadota bacterium]|nr:hypothetical protein [Armatimonadota bacterium]
MSKYLFAAHFWETTSVIPSPPEAVIVSVDGAPARVFTAEHLAAVALRTGCARDKARLLQFVESDAIDMTRFLAILTRHGLLDRWDVFERTLLRGGS